MDERGKGIVEQASDEAKDAAGEVRAAGDDVVEAADGAKEEAAHGLDRVRAFAGEHPTAVLVAGAGATLLLGAEVAAGAVIGMGVVMLLGDKTGAELRRDLWDSGRRLLMGTAHAPRTLWRRGKRMMRREGAATEPPAASRASSAPAGEAQHRP